MTPASSQKYFKALQSSSLPKLEGMKASFVSTQKCESFIKNQLNTGVKNMLRNHSSHFNSSSHSHVHMRTQKSIMSGLSGVNLLESTIQSPVPHHKKKVKAVKRGLEVRASLNQP
jgi:hypothetical protein